MTAEQPDPTLALLARLVRETVEEVLGPTLDAFESVRAAADDLEDDAALGRRVRDIIAPQGAEATC